ncbi:DUF4340 domain-containing protein [Planctomycetota bacterium]
MKVKTLFFLGILAGAMMALSAFTYYRERASLRAARISGHLLPELNVDTIAAIRLSKGADELRFTREGERFVLASHHDYPASNKAINSLLRDCSNIEIARKVTSNPTRFNNLGVSKAGIDNPDTISVGFYDEADKPLRVIIIGNSPEGAYGRFVRRADADDVFLSKDSIYIRVEANHYVNREVLNLKTDAIKTIFFTGQPPLLLKHGDGDQWLLNQVPEGRKQDDQEAKSTASAAARITLNEFIHYENEKVAGLKFDKKVTLTLDNKAVYAIELAKKEEDCFIRLGAKWRQKIVVHKEDDEETLKKTEALVKAAEEIENFDKRHKGWVYQIGESKYDQLTKSLEDMLEAVEEEEEPKEEDPGEEKHGEENKDGQPKNDTEKSGEDIKKDE